MSAATAARLPLVSRARLADRGRRTRPATLLPKSVHTIVSIASASTLRRQSKLSRIECEGAKPASDVNR
jgi:hypothetical protein